MTPKYDIEVQLTGEDGNIFNLMSIVTNAMKRNGVPKEERDEMTSKIFESGSYQEALTILREYVQVL